MAEPIKESHAAVGRQPDLLDLVLREHNRLTDLARAYDSRSILGRAPDQLQGLALILDRDSHAPRVQHRASVSLRGALRRIGVASYAKSESKELYEGCLANPPRADHDVEPRDKLDI